MRLRSDASLCPAGRASACSAAAAGPCSAPRLSLDSVLLLWYHNLACWRKDATLCRSGGIGRRPGLKIPWEQSRAGSTPVSGTTYRGIEQLVARRAHNPEVGGSSPPPATRNPLESPDFSGLFLFLATFPRGLFFALKFDPDFDPYGEKVRSRRAFLCLDLTAFLGRFLRFRELLSIPVPWPWPPPFAPPWSRGHRYPR